MKASIPFLTALLAGMPFLQAADAPAQLTLSQAEQLALKQHPRISVAELTAMAARQAAREVQSALLPNIFASATAVGTGDPNNTRIAAGALNNPLIYERQADGATISQLITDFGRTWDLTKSARLDTQAEQMNVVATRAAILLEVDNAFYSALQSQAVLQVAKETMQERQYVLQQTEAMVTNKLKSSLDLSFATVDYDQAGILFAKARNDLQAGLAVLSEALGEPRPQAFQLVEEPLPAYTSNDFSALLLEAIANRPELAQLRFRRDSAQVYASAQRKLDYPSINALATAGVIPTGNSHLSDDYEAAGVNLTVPIYTGGLNAARRREAELKATAASEALRDEEDIIARDVELATLNLDYAWQRLALTQQLYTNAAQALELAQARYHAGSTSIIELSQAELGKTSADIDAATARYDFAIQRKALDFQLGRLR